MTTRTVSMRNILLAAGDSAVFALALGSALLIRHGGIPDAIVLGLWRLATPFLVALWLTGFAVFGLYDLSFAKNEPRFFERLARALLFNLVITVLFFYFVPDFGLRPLVTLFMIFFFLAIFLFAWRSVYNRLIAQHNRERVLFVGITPTVIELARFLKENPQLGFSPRAYIQSLNGSNSSQPIRVPESLMVECVGDPSGAIRREGIQRVVTAPGIKRTRRLIGSLFSLLPLGLAIVDFDRFYESVHGKVPVSLINEAWFIENLIGRERPRYEFAKRILDLILVVGLGLLTITAVPFIAAAIIFSTPKDIFNYKSRRARLGDGIIFFRQKRMGKNGSTFDFIKFRSQVLGAERFGSEKEGASPDPRSYPIGEFLRKTYLDELPQLWNVLRGEMSFVGPRPERPEFLEGLEREISFYRMRELVLPGITGWAQINMEDDASVSDAPEKMQYDLYYIKNRSLFLDFSILLKTVLKLMQRSGR